MQSVCVVYAWCKLGQHTAAWGTVGSEVQLCMLVAYSAEGAGCKLCEDSGHLLL